MVLWYLVSTNIFLFSCRLHIRAVLFWGRLHEECAYLPQYIYRYKYDRQRKDSRQHGTEKGVKPDASIRNATTACRRYVEKKLLLSMPSFDRSTATSGSSNTSPIMNISIRKLFIYESKDNWLLIVALIWKLYRNLNVSGNTRKYPIAQPT